MPGEAPRSTKAGVDADKKLELGGGAALLLVFAAVALFHGAYVWGAVLLALSGGAFFMMRNSSFVGPCPNCGTPIRELADGGRARCPGCFLYSTRRGETLTELDRGGDVRGSFLIPLPVSGPVQSPPLCWKCGTPARSLREVSGAVDFSNNPYIRSARTYSLRLADCGRHRDSPVIRLAAAGSDWKGLRRAGAISGDAKTSAHASLEVGDYGFYTEYLKANGLLG